MQHFIIGSRLMAQLFPDNEKIKKRLKEDADYDILINEDLTPEIKKYFQGIYQTNKVDLHYIPILWPIFCQQYSSFNQRPFPPHAPISDKRNVLFTLKASHVSFDPKNEPNWQKKTFYDLFLMSEEGCTIIEPLFYELHQFWTDKFGERWRADFTKESSDFFDDAVSRENVHDDLHRAVAFYDQPAFKFLQDPRQTTVWVDPVKFYSVDEHIRQRVVIEEAQTLALERFILPGKISNKNIAYQKTVEALVDRLAPLWMTIYIINNLNFFLNYKEDYGSLYLSQTIDN